MNAIDRTASRATASTRPSSSRPRYSAPNYAPLPVVLTRGEDAYLWDTAGRRYVDMMSAYSAVSLGHAHPRILAALTAQANRLAVPSRAYYSDRLGPFLAEICRLTGLDAALPMNTGAEAVETAIKAARRWGYRVKGIAERQAPRSSSPPATSTAAPPRSSASRPEPDYRDGFGPFTPGFKRGAVRRSRRGRARDHARHRRRPDRADPGRGRHHRAARRLSRRAAPALRREQRAADPRRGAVRSRPHRPLVRLSSTRASGPTG